jgi:hypothetical protein
MSQQVSFIFVEQRSGAIQIEPHQRALMLQEQIVKLTVKSQ